VETIKVIIRKAKPVGKRCCIECRSSDIEYFHRVYIEGEIFSFPYCRNCGLIQWNVISVFHLSLEKLYELYLQLVDQFQFPKEKILEDLEYIKQRKGEEGYSDDEAILKEIFGNNKRS